MKTETIAAKDVKSGDEIWAGNRDKYGQLIINSLHWVKVNNVNLIETSLGFQIKIKTNVWTTYLHPEQGVAVRRSA